MDPMLQVELELKLWNYQRPLCSLQGTLEHAHRCTTTQGPFIGVTAGCSAAGLLFIVAVFAYASARRILVFIPRL